MPKKGGKGVGKRRPRSSTSGRFLPKKAKSK